MRGRDFNKAFCPNFFAATRIDNRRNNVVHANRTDEPNPALPITMVRSTLVCLSFYADILLASFTALVGVKVSQGSLAKVSMSFGSLETWKLNSGGT